MWPVVDLKTFWKLTFLQKFRCVPTPFPVFFPHVDIRYRILISRVFRIMHEKNTECRNRAYVFRFIRKMPNGRQWGFVYPVKYQQDGERTAAERIAKYLGLHDFPTWNSNSTSAEKCQMALLCFDHWTRNALRHSFNALLITYLGSVRWIFRTYDEISTACHLSPRVSI